MSRKRKKKRPLASSENYRLPEIARNALIADRKDRLAVINAPIDPMSSLDRVSDGCRRHKIGNDQHGKEEMLDTIQIINGVVSTTGRYSRLHEDYDDK